MLAINLSIPNEVKIKCQMPDTGERAMNKKNKEAKTHVKI